MEEMDRAAFGRFVNRVGQMLEYVPEVQETKLVHLLRASLHPADPSRDPKVELAMEINRMYLYLGESKSRELLRICRDIHVELDENLTKPDADRLWEQLLYLHQTWFEDSILV
jgi:hypothetical protein